MATPQRCDVFCKVVDNFGDIGVCWRLCKQLAEEYAIHITLYLDDFAAAQAIIPSLKATPSQQKVGPISIAPWPTAPVKLPALVIESFSCGLPAQYAQQVASQQADDANSIHWLNLEYLSAESWVEEVHLMPSIHPQLGCKRVFFYPGFSPKTGGLIKETALASQQAKWADDKVEADFWQTHTRLPASQLNSLKLSLFCYPHAPLISLINALAKSTTPITLFAPCSSASTTFKTLSQAFSFDQNDTYRNGNVCVHRVAFLCQLEYDQLLSYCDLNLVRGEDSWLRALWSGKPFIWQPYWQTDETHLTKLKAFLKAYTQASETDSHMAAQIHTAHLAWSNAVEENTDWLAMFAQLPQWQQASKQASQHFQRQADLAKQLMQWFAQQAVTT